MAKATETKSSSSSRAAALGRRAKLLKGQQLLKPILKPPKDSKKTAEKKEKLSKDKKEKKEGKKVKLTIEKTKKVKTDKKTEEGKKPKKQLDPKRTNTKEKKVKPSENDKRMAAPTTPPTKRVSFKSPPASLAGSVESEADAAIKKILRNQAKAALKGRDGLERALSEAEIKAMLDGAGIEKYLDYIHGTSDQTAAEALEPEPPAEKPKTRDVRAEGNASLAEALMARKVEAAAAVEASESCAGSEGESEAEQSEHSEEQDEDVSASEGEKSENESEPAPSDGSDEEASAAEEASSPEPESSEQEESDNGEPAEEPPKKVEPPKPVEVEEKVAPEKAGKEVQKAATETVEMAKTVRNSVTNKAEWDKYVRQVGNRNVFPAKLAPAFAKSKTDLFNLWLDSGMDWEKTTVLAERKRLTRSLSRNQLEAVQAKELYEKRGSEKAQQLIAMREKEGMWYPDDDFPQDPMERWYYMPRGRILREDGVVEESLSLHGKAAVDKTVMEALTNPEGGPLASGMLPSVRAQTEAGQKRLLEALDENRAAVKKVKVPKAKKVQDEENSVLVAAKKPQEQLVCSRAFGVYTSLHIYI